MDFFTQRVVNFLVVQRTNAPRIDPLKLLSCLSVLLSPQGGIKSDQEVPRLSSLMAKFSKKLVSKCIYIQILKSSDTELLCKFMGAGGWSLTHLWLQDSITTKNWPLAQEILELLLSCPVDVERLKSNSAPRLVKNLSKDQTNTEGVRLLANKLVDQWLKIVRGETKPEAECKKEDESIEEDVKPEKEKLILKISKNQVVKPAEKEEEVKTEEAPAAAVVEETVKEEEEEETVKLEEEMAAPAEPEQVEEDKEETEKKDEKKKEVKEKENKDKERDRHKKSSSSKHKSSSSSSKSSSSSSSKSKSGNTSSSSNSSNKDRHKSSSSSSSGSKSKSSSTSSSRDREKKKEKKEKVEEIPQSVKDAKALVETAPNSVFKLGKIPKKPRTEEDSAEKKVTKAAPVAPKAKPSFSIEERDPEKRAKTVKMFNSKFRSHGLEGYEPPPPPTRKETKSTPTSTTTTTPAPVITAVKRASPTRIDPPAEKRPRLEDRNESKSKPKHVLVETDLFSDALAASASSVSRKKIDASKKRKRRLSSTKDEKSPGTPTSPTGAAPLKFYQDTLDEENAEKEPGDTRGPKQGRNSLDNTLDESAEKAEDEEPEEEEPVKKAPGIGTGPDGPPGILKIRTRKGNKKKLTWKVQEELEEVRFFELDETERVNVTKTFIDMQHMDRMQERQSLIMARKLPTDDIMVERTAWAPLIEVECANAHPMGKDSVERGVQAARERTILKALYFNKATIPDSPAEPDPEMHPMTDPKVVPLDDATCNVDGVNDFRNMPWPESKGDAPPAQPMNNTFAPFGNFPPPQTQVPPQMAIPMNPAWAQPMPFVNSAINMGQLPSIGPMGLMAQFPPNPVFDAPPMHMGGPMPPFDNRGPPQRDWMRGNADRFNRAGNGGNRRNFDDRDRRMGGGNRRNICHNYQKYGNCRLGDKCSYFHPR